MAWTPQARARVGALGSGARLSEAQFALLSPLLPAAKPGGRPRRVDVRAVLEAIFLVLRTGCQWRHLPPGHPPWPTVYGYLRAWMADGTWDRLLEALRVAERQAQGRAGEPTAGVIDTQSARTSEKGGPGAGTRPSA